LTLDEILNDPRVEIYDTHFNFFLNNPIIGIGIAGSENILYSYQSSHNIFIEIASEFGILGLIPFSGMIILLINKYLISKDFSFSYLWLYTFIVVQFSGDVSLNSIYWFISAIFISIPLDKFNYEKSINKYYENITSNK
jgi:O-antigen ligase